MRWALGATVFLAVTASAADYGAAPCSAVGDFAAAVVHNRNAGVTRAQEIKRLHQLLSRDDPAYPAYLAIVEDLYSGQPWAKALSEAGARTAYTLDCRNPQP